MLTYLILLICPVTMGAMMLWMMRGRRRDGTPPEEK
ncbi:MAG: DUF2933 domain-containing protein [Gaiellaceae bacterium]